MQINIQLIPARPVGLSFGCLRWKLPRERNREIHKAAFFSFFFFFLSLIFSKVLFSASTFHQRPVGAVDVTVAACLTQRKINSDYNFALSHIEDLVPLDYISMGLQSMADGRSWRGAGGSLLGSFKERGAVAVAAAAVAEQAVAAMAVGRRKAATSNIWGRTRRRGKREVQPLFASGEEERGGLSVFTGSVATPGF